MKAFTKCYLFIFVIQVVLYSVRQCLCYIFYDKILNYSSFPRLLDFMLRKNID